MPEKKICPLIAGECLRDGCTWWVRIHGKTPQDNKEIDLHDCAIAWFPALTLETTKAVRATNDAVEAMRSESRQSFAALFSLFARASHRAPPPPESLPHHDNGG